jgi:hypothetical protein
MRSQKYAHIDFNKRLTIRNFPGHYSENVIRKFVEEFSKIKAMEMEHEDGGKRFTGTVHIDFESDYDT